MKTLVLAFVFALTYLNAYSQEASSDSVRYPAGYYYYEEDKPQPWPKHRLGAIFSTISASGLSYQYQFNDMFSLKFSGYAYADVGNDETYYYDYNQDDLITSIGAEFQVNLHRSNSTRFYLLAGLGHEYQQTTKVTFQNVYPNSNVRREDTEIHRYFTFGTGFGIELLAWKHISFNLDLGYMFQGGWHSYPKQQYDPYNNYPKSDKTLKIHPAVGIGAYYAF